MYTVFIVTNGAAFKHADKYMEFKAADEKARYMANEFHSSVAIEVVNKRGSIITRYVGKQ